MANVRNYEEYRAEVLDRLGDDYTVEDLRNTERWRLRVLDMLSGGGSGGGGGSDFSTANVTVQISNATHLFLPAKNEGEPIASVPFAPVSDMEEMTIEVILYKGSAMALWTGIDTLTVSGNIQAIKNGLYMITGDCTIKTQIS